MFLLVIVDDEDWCMFLLVSVDDGGPHLRLATASASLDSGVVLPSE